MTQSFVVHHVYYTGRDVEPAGLTFSSKGNFLFGASNTGKSFTLKSIDFMLGGDANSLPDIDERQPYDHVLLGIELPTIGKATLMRATKGGPFSLFPGLLVDEPRANPVRTLGARFQEGDPDSLSIFLLEQLGLANKKIAKNTSGQKQNLSFRNLIRYCLVDETSIQAPIPAISGLRPDETVDRLFFGCCLPDTTTPQLLSI